jgi:hypothetical protein
LRHIRHARTALWTKASREAIDELCRDVSYATRVSNAEQSRQSSDVSARSIQSIDMPSLATQAMRRQGCSARECSTIPADFLRF